ncbi:PepSY domain-containing protein [Psychrobacillus sp. NPDC058041]|uniref:PepSY domain-containing protein n=1 Tax=Psychrobacillus sp. NPDC058041 TaxID=3346310 RepID=UPI0036D80E38
MKFFKQKGILSIFIVIIVALVIGIVLNITHNPQSISENDFRSHLEQMYDAEVAGVTMKQDVYKAVITKSGVYYLVEMNPVTGDVYSLEQTDEFVDDKPSNKTEKSAKVDEENTLEISEQPLLETNDEIKTTAIVEIVKPPAKIIITEKPQNLSIESDTTKTTKSTVVVSPKGLKSIQSKLEEKTADDKDEKQIKEIIKFAIKDVLKLEQSKAEETKTDKTKEEKPKEEVAKGEVAKTETVKTESVKEESTQIESSKTDEVKVEESQTPPAKTLTIQSDTKKTDTESKNEKTSTILITEEQAIKTAIQQVKGTVENSSFVKTNEGGYYLVVMKASLPETDSKEASKTKKSKATIQVHAISGKILSVTWE